MVSVCCVGLFGIIGFELFWLVLAMRGIVFGGLCGGRRFFFVGFGAEDFGCLSVRGIGFVYWFRAGFYLGVGFC